MPATMGCKSVLLAIIAACASSQSAAGFHDAKLPVSTATPRYVNDHNSALRGRNLITGTNDDPEGFSFLNFKGVVRLDFPIASGTFICTGTLTDPTIIVTAPQCLPSALRVSTSTSNWAGASLTLGTAYKVYAGDSAKTEIGHMVSATYVNAAAEGSQLATIRFQANAAGLALLGSIAYSYATNEPGPGALGVAVGYGPLTSVSSNGVLTQTGATSMRNATMLITETGTAVSQVSVCYARSWGGQLYMQEENLGAGIGVFNTARLCVRGGDLGAPFFIKRPATAPVVYDLAGIFVGSDDSDCVGKPNARHSFTSLAYRAEWIRQQTDTLNARTYNPPACPLTSPSAIPSPTASRTPSPSASSALQVLAPSPEPAFFQRQVNLIWIIVLACFLGLLVLVIVIYTRYRQAQINAYFRVKPELQKVLATPAAGQKGPAMVTDYQAGRQDVQERAREGEFVTPVRRMSVVAPTADALAAAEAARAARKERRRSSMVGNLPSSGVQASGRSAEGANEAPVTGQSGGSDGPAATSSSSSERRGSVARRGSVTTPGRRASTGTGAPMVEGRRRQSLAMARAVDRAYDQKLEPGGGDGNRYSTYEGQAGQSQRPADMLAPGVVPHQTDEEEV